MSQPITFKYGNETAYDRITSHELFFRAIDARDYKWVERNSTRYVKAYGRQPMDGFINDVMNYQRIQDQVNKDSLVKRLRF